ncbi:hypothetical protein EAH75_01235 [Rhodanobacter glycinis]|uniref:hypothetical protein n=1 Tax=Rhodanobacter glycinis TaxID=582702 RepID=UPI001126AFBA|nr:hypothetical protein [Rhodanobacter glycinis]TPG50150.1 hypothetical protein EAH75_01235 [Rhodanobacter glycinis]
MTLPQVVQDAVKNVARSLRDVFIEEDIVHEQIAEIRAHITSQEAEIERLLGRAVPLSEWQIMESRLAAANALLREALQETLSNVGFMAMHNITYGSIESSSSVAKRIEHHLQGAGDE